MTDQPTSLPNPKSGTAGSDQTAVSASAPTEIRSSEPTAPLSDVMLASVLEATIASNASDVVLATEMSDVAPAHTGTVRAPSFRAPSPPLSGSADPGRPILPRPATKPAKRDQTPMALLPGAKVDDFEIVRLLGRGAFGHVYLARQLTLDRLVALKVSANRGSEGRTMARLEHQNIVQVYSETVDLDFNQRLLCMQLVPGVGLDKLIGMLHALKVAGAEQAAKSKEKASAAKEQGAASEPPAPSPPPPAADWTGAQMLEIIDRSGSMPTALDPSALHDREALAKMDAIEATAWFGSRLAEALDFAHRHGVLHRDIKPANILVNPYGRPMLADFNISSQPVGSETSGEEMFGGTFAYMSPEHLDAFNPGDATGHDAVTSRSDIYSLGLVLQQLLEGRLSFPTFNRKAKMADTLRQMADERRRESPICKPGQPGARMTLERTLGRCVEPTPDDRFASGAELAAQLEGCRRMREAELQLPPVRSAFSKILLHPFLWLVILVVLPQIAGSIVNITYNQTQIVNDFNDLQKAEFKQLVLIYNAIIYPIAVALFVVIVRRVWKCWNALAAGERLSEAEVKATRQKVLRIPRFIAALAAFGWFPGGFIFPIAMAFTTGLEFPAAAHFLASFCLSGLIALAYSLCGVEFVVLRALYPALWHDARNFTETTRKELGPIQKQLSRMEVLAVLVPLVAAIVTLMVGDVSREAMIKNPDGAEFQLIVFKLLVASLILLGILGFHIASSIARDLSRVVVALTNTKA